MFGKYKVGLKRGKKEKRLKIKGSGSKKNLKIA